MSIKIVHDESGCPFQFRLQGDKLMVMVGWDWGNFYELTNFIENNIIEEEFLEIFNEGANVFNLQLIFKPTLISVNKNKIIASSIVQKTFYDDEKHTNENMFFKVENNVLLVFYKKFKNGYIPVLELLKKENQLSKKEIDVITEGAEEYGLRPIFKPTLIKMR